MSPSSQRAWIEIFGPYYPFKVYEVALLAEGVDRNRRSYSLRSSAIVALLAEGVDRNFSRKAADEAARKSPSSQRAWIEISAERQQTKQPASRPPRRGRG